jgi:hypothetical protein
MALRGKPPRRRGTGGFLGGMRSARPRGKARRKPRDFITRDGWASGPGPRGIHGEASLPRACGARPSTGRLARGWPSGEDPRDDAKGVFLGGTRSARPGCRASRMARTFITDGG